MAKSFTISVFTENSPGVLHRLTTTFTKRKINIESLTVSETEEEGISRFTIVVNIDASMAATLVKQIARIIEVKDAYANENEDLIYKEIALYRVLTPNPAARTQVEEVAHRHKAKVIYAVPESLIVEATGTEEDNRSLYRLLEPFGIIEFVHSGRIAMCKEFRVVAGKLAGNE